MESLSMTPTPSHISLKYTVCINNPVVFKLKVGTVTRGPEIKDDYWGSKQ